MSGHNKWSKIKYVKAKEDAKKGKVFARFAHEIMLAAKSGGGDPDLNPRLRAAIDGAKAVSTPKENIERAIKKGTGELGGATIQEITYEGYGPSGTAFLIEVATDNTNRSASELRTLFTKTEAASVRPVPWLTSLNARERPASWRKVLRRIPPWIWRWNAARMMWNRGIPTMNGCLLRAQRS